MIIIIIQKKNVEKPTKRSNLQNAMKRDVVGLQTGFEPWESRLHCNNSPRSSCCFIKVSLVCRLNQTQYEDTERDYTVCHSIHWVPLSVQIDFFFFFLKKKKRKKSCSAHHKQTYRWGKPGGFKGADVWTGCRYSLSPLAAAASRFAPTTPTCFLSIKPTATATASHRPGIAVRGRSREI